MQIYRCKVVIGSNGRQMTGEVRRDEVTAPELIILQAIHGADWVTDVHPVRMDKREHLAERERLRLTYGTALARLEPKQSVDSLFGPPFNPLPVRAMGINHGDEPEVEAPTKRRGRPPAPVAEAEAAFG